MANIVDYIKWRGDLTFEQSPFNEIDNLILARMAYLPFDNIIESAGGMKLEEAYNIIKKVDIKKLRILQKEDTDLIRVAAQSRRFGNLYISNYVNKIDVEQEKQFSAITITLPDDTIYVSFRGTDNSLVGFKEDFNMSFMELIPSQSESVEYLNNIGSNCNKKLRVGGHSKGGNLAVYASAYCNKEIKERIITVYNNDGPGFFESVINSKEYKSIIEKVHKYQPQSSVIGRLLENKEKGIIVKSTQVGLMQHDAYTWQVLGTKFEYEKALTKESELTNKRVIKWLETVTPEQREKFIGTIFTLLKVIKAETIEDLTSKKLSSIRKILKSYKDIDEDSKRLVYETLWVLIRIR